LIVYTKMACLFYAKPVVNPSTIITKHITKRLLLTMRIVEQTTSHVAMDVENLIWLMYTNVS